MNIQVRHFPTAQLRRPKAIVAGLLGATVIAAAVAVGLDRTGSGPADSPARTDLLTPTDVYTMLTVPQGEPWTFPAPARGVAPQATGTEPVIFLVSLEDDAGFLGFAVKAERTAFVVLSEGHPGAHPSDAAFVSEKLGVDVVDLRSS